MNCVFALATKDRDDIGEKVMLNLKRVIAGLAPALAVIALLYGFGVGLTGSFAFDNAAVAQEAGQVPGNSLGGSSDSEFWRTVRSGDAGTVSIPDKKAGVMVQTQGEAWRNYRNGPLSSFGVWVILGIIAILALFFAIRGRIRVDSGLSGKFIQRFNKIELVAHWLTAGSFVILAITGLNMLYGRYLFAGGASPTGDFSTLQSVFAAITLAGKYAHNYLAFAFMAGLVLTFVLWLRDNIPNMLDVKWLAVGGGLFSKGVHPPSRKFNAGQKFIFWIVILGGLSLSFSGVSLMFPDTFAMFAKTYAVLNVFGFSLNTNLSGIEEMQIAQIWHSLVAAVMIAIIIAHIYIGSLGMEGAFDAMATGRVDENWAREHHSIWVAELKGETPVDDGSSSGGAKAGAKGDSGASPQTT